MSSNLPQKSRFKFYFPKVGDKEWEKFRVAFVIQGKAHYVEEDEKTVITKVDI